MLRNDSQVIGFMPLKGNAHIAVLLAQDVESSKQLTGQKSCFRTLRSLARIRLRAFFDSLCSSFESLALRLATHRTEPRIA